MPALDGLRGLAVAGVLLFHANGALPGGFLGVDLFFVLSGYLITSLLLAEHASTGRIDLRTFWIRRARRLFPALLGLMVGVALYAVGFAQRAELVGLRHDAIATLAYVANWRTIWISRSYWNLFAAPSPLEHTWSLAIEEQFYVVWPLLLIAVLRASGTARSRRAVLSVSLVLALVSMARMAWLFDPAQSSRVYLGTDTRASGILLGAALATELGPGTRVPQSAARALDALGVCALALIAWAWCTARGDEARLYRGVMWCTELADLVLIACAVAGRASFVARALSFRPLAALGTLSYGVYLWHWPVDVVLTADRLGLGPLPLTAARLAVTFVIAYASYRFLEAPIRHHGLRVGRPALAVASAVALAVGLVFGGTYARARTLPPPPPPPLNPTPAPEEVMTFRLLVVGDSTANALGWTLRGVRPPGLAVELAGENAFNLLVERAGNRAWSESAKELRPDATIVALGGAFLYGLSRDGEWRRACFPEWDERFEVALRRWLSDLAMVSTSTWVATSPYPLGPYDKGEFRTQVDCVNASIRRVVGATERVKLLDLAAIECPRGECQRFYRGKALRPDGMHYDLEGAKEIGLEVLARIR